MADNDKSRQRKDLQVYQGFFIAFSIIGALGVLVVALIALFVFICSAKYLVVSFTLESAKIFPALVLTFIGFCVVAVFVFSEVILIKKYIKSLKEFQKEKKEAQSSSDVSQ